MGLLVKAIVGNGDIYRYLQVIKPHEAIKAISLLSIGHGADWWALSRPGWIFFEQTD